MRRCSKLSTIIRWDLWQTDEKCIAIYLRHLEIVQLTGLWHAQSVPGCFEGKGYQVFFRAVTNKLRSHGVEYTPDGVHSDGTSTFEVWGLSLANTLTVCLSLSLSLSFLHPFRRPFEKQRNRRFQRLTAQTLHFVHEPRQLFSRYSTN